MSLCRTTLDSFGDGCLRESAITHKSPSPGQRLGQSEAFAHMMAGAPQTVQLSLSTIVVLGLWLHAAPSSADTTLSSSAEPTNLIELYTSEGCSSCPPADRWLSGLKDHPALWTQLIPLEFHVDYWDDLGWKDRFAQAAFTDRQRRYAHESHMRAIYTPGLISNGKEWRNFSWRPPTVPAAPSAGSLVADIGATELSIRYQPDSTLAGRDRLIANTALLGFGLASYVAAGENRGRELRHDFVVLAHEQTPLKLANGAYEASLKRPQPAVSAERYAVVVWVSTQSSQAPVKALGGWLD
jgi:hypothetical protein